MKRNIEDQEEGDRKRRKERIEEEETIMRDTAPQEEPMEGQEKQSIKRRAEDEHEDSQGR